MSAPDPGIYISPTQMYQEVRALAEGVGRIEGKLDQALRENVDLRGDIQDHEKRLRELEAQPKVASVNTQVTALSTRMEKVEHQTWRSAGASAVIAGACVVLGQVFLPMIFR